MSKCISSGRLSQNKNALSEILLILEYGYNQRKETFFYFFFFGGGGGGGEGDEAIDPEVGRIRLIIHGGRVSKIYNRCLLTRLSGK